MPIESFARLIFDQEMEDCLVSGAVDVANRPPTTIHTIETDDPLGVEAYWHNRFGEKRGEGEWFELVPDDARAFKRWKKIV